MIWSKKTRKIGKKLNFDLSLKLIIANRPIPKRMVSKAIEKCLWSRRDREPIESSNVRIGFVRNLTVWINDITWLHISAKRGERVLVLCPCHILNVPFSHPLNFELIRPRAWEQIKVYEIFLINFNVAIVNFTSFESNRRSILVINYCPIPS